MMIEKQERKYPLFSIIRIYVPEKEETLDVLILTNPIIFHSLETGKLHIAFRGLRDSEKKEDEYCIPIANILEILN